MDETGNSKAVHARSKVKRVRIRQFDIAIACDISQSQVSRVLSVKSTKYDGAFEKICSYVDSMDESVRSGRSVSKLLRDAINETWDGSRDHAVALALVIRSLGALAASAHRN